MCDRQSQSIPSAIGLQGSTVRQLVSLDTLGFHPAAEPDVGREDADPVEGAKNSHETDQIAKDTRRGFADVHVSQEHKDRRRGDAVHGNSPLRRVEKDGRGVAVLCQRVERTGADVYVGVGRRDDKHEKAGVDDVGKDLDAADGHGDDVGGRGRADLGLGGTDESFVVVRDGHAEGQDTDDVEEADAPEGLPDGAGDCDPRVRRLAECRAHDFGARVREARLDHAGPETQEAAEGSGLQVFGKGSWVFPVLKADSAMGRGAAERYNQAGDHNGDESYDLDG
ncbi:uncharacterized protein PgNI_02382 [Pyricularia grisea]|uniref:Uncharacterized protein n=1 Tax=Pyricularia grisea TaxID=148305 RepID=A0A6P8BMD7_PYRGI|nr:uncharacterized protein PgNI_02382 [Pyricularia grisea]TLD17780.1 hypothetical protein PgNI_02382 [Pyricularia grisea]